MSIWRQFQESTHSNARSILYQLRPGSLFLSFPPPSGPCSTSHKRSISLLGRMPTICPCEKCRRPRSGGPTETRCSSFSSCKDQNGEGWIMMDKMDRNTSYMISYGIYMVWLMVSISEIWAETYKYHMISSDITNPYFPFCGLNFCTSQRFHMFVPNIQTCRISMRNWNISRIPCPTPCRPSTRATWTRRRRRHGIEMECWRFHGIPKHRFIDRCVWLILICFPVCIFLYVQYIYIYIFIYLYIYIYICVRLGGHFTWDEVYVIKLTGHFGRGQMPPPMDPGTRKLWLFQDLHGQSYQICVYIYTHSCI